MLYLLLCGWASSSSCLAAEGDERIALAGVLYRADLPTLVAERHRLFARHGLDVEVRQNASGKRNLTELLAGRVHYALMAVTPFVLHRALTFPTPGVVDPVIIASIAHDSGVNEVVTLADGPISRPADLQGGRIGLTAGTNAEYLWWLYGVVHRLDAGRARMVDLPVQTIGAALLAGDIDAAVLWEPWISRLEGRGLSPSGERRGATLRRLPGAEIYVEKWLLVADRGRLARRPDEARALLAAYAEAIALIETDPPAVAGLAAEHEGAGAGRAHPAVAFGLTLDWTLLASLLQHVEWLQRSNRLDPAAALDVLDWLDARPLQAQAPGRVGIPVAAPDRDGVLR